MRQAISPGGPGLADTTTNQPPPPPQRRRQPLLLLLLLRLTRCAAQAMSEAFEEAVATLNALPKEKGPSDNDSRLFIYSHYKQVSPRLPQMFALPLCPAATAAAAAAARPAALHCTDSLISSGAILIACNAPGALARTGRRTECRKMPINK